MYFSIFVIWMLFCSNVFTYSFMQSLLTGKTISFLPPISQKHLMRFATNTLVHPYTHAHISLRTYLSIYLGIFHFVQVIDFHAFGKMHKITEQQNKKEGRGQTQRKSKQQKKKLKATFFGFTILTSAEFGFLSALLLLLPYVFLLYLYCVYLIFMLKTLSS